MDGGTQDMEGGSEGRQEGRKEGAKGGKKEGRKGGREDGRKEGRKERRKGRKKEGKQEGTKEGKQEGWKEVNRGVDSQNKPVCGLLASRAQDFQSATIKATATYSEKALQGLQLVAQNCLLTRIKNCPALLP